MNDTLTWPYPKPVFYASSTEYVLGSEDAEAQMSWCIATAYFISLPIGTSPCQFGVSELTCCKGMIFHGLYIIWVLDIKATSRILP